MANLAEVKLPSPGHLLSRDDPDNPMNWPFHRRVYASAVAWAFAFVVAYGLTTYTAGLPQVMASFNVSMTTAISGMSLYLFGIAFAPIHTPHLSERVGRSIVYLVSLSLFALFTLGAGLSRNFASLAICRFLAGFCGGPCLVLIEGTFADIWSAETTNTYYAFLGLASYIGAAVGPIVGGFVVTAKGWRWLEWTTLMITLVVLVFGIGIPETYGREIPRRRNRRRGLAPPHQSPAESGVTFGQMFQVTVLTPLRMLVTEPVVIMTSLYLGFNFALVFQWFITVPVVLEGVYGFTRAQAGVAFTSAIGGAVLAAITTIVIEQVQYRRGMKAALRIEERLIPAMIGGTFMTASLFWVGWTASPKIHWISPVLGTALYVWGSLLVVISFIAYLFDAYPPAGTLAALTAAASLRLLLAGALPLVIIQMFTKLTGAWALSLFGFISIALLPIPLVLYKWGPALRTRSRYSGSMMMKSRDMLTEMGTMSMDRSSSALLATTEV
ncbi:MFS general substrate transporter [Lepidopterella palustris CBS 459.81]|uniref:MFS general substrate transporter n=1 Tax=Lepidopterella palustris CBS 459.81 TaxID=1314670 RepID=A0A8E2EL85_9PEZI|nr:MFS general substrate transporter [Lepidopterella palustris CBS 459.81]